jgi:RNA polymerase sigma-70 factor (ECF subfamily)
MENMKQNVNAASIKEESAIKAQNILADDLSQCLTYVATQQSKQAFTILFRYFCPKIVRYGIGKLGNKTLANELVQETMTNIWQKAHLYDPNKGSATTWVYTIMRNVAFDMLRKVNFRAEQQLSDDIWPQDAFQSIVTDDEVDFEDHLESRHISNQVDRLPEAQKAVIRAVYYQGLSQEQLAQQLGVSVGTVKSRIRLALDKLKQSMGGADHD